LSTNKEREVWGQLIEKDPTMRHRLSELRFNVFKNILESLGQTEQQAEKLSSEALQIFMNGRHQLTLFDGVEEVLAQLKEKYTLGVLTNGNADIKRLGIDHYFNFSFSAEELNDSKPSETHFKRAMEHTSEKATNICHIGDHTECDVEGALNAGCKAIWYNELNNEWPDSKGCPVQEIKSWYDMEEAIARC
jgi:putative hydrolase of the HAD superfamily